MLLIKDPWQLPRASRAFSCQGLQMQPFAAEPPLSAPDRNPLALSSLQFTLVYPLLAALPPAAVDQEPAGDRGTAVFLPL